MLWADAFVIGFYAYVFFGGWLATLACWSMSVVIGFRQKRPAPAVISAALGLLPVGYLAGLFALTSDGLHARSSTAAGVLLLIGLLIGIAVGPVVAFIALRRGRHAYFGR